MGEDFQLFPDQASTMAPRVDHLFYYILAVGLFFALLIAVLLLVFAVRYRRRREDHYPRPVIGSTLLEAAWIGIPLLLALVMFGWSASVYMDMVRPPENATEVYVTGRQWMWHLQHPEGQREINRLHVPAGKPVKLIMTSEDVIHSFYVPAFRVKQDVIPGRYTYLWFEATRPGTYHLFCAEYCGTNHSRMIGQVIVMEPAEYERWLGRNADRSLALQGRQLFQKLQCVTCHSAEAGGRAPVLEGLYGREVELEGGKRVTADESYLRESILYPDAKVVAGYRPIMPPFKGQVDEDDLVRLVAFLKALGPGETPPRVERSTPPEAKEEKSKEKDKGKEKGKDKGKTK
jgi:cytochrome c oxidase subunit II